MKTIDTPPFKEAYTLADLKLATNATLVNAINKLDAAGVASIVSPRTGLTVREILYSLIEEVQEFSIDKDGWQVLGPLPLDAKF